MLDRTKDSPDINTSSNIGNRTTLTRPLSTPDLSQLRDTQNWNLQSRKNSNGNYISEPPSSVEPGIYMDCKESLLLNPTPQCVRTHVCKDCQSNLLILESLCSRPTVRYFTFLILFPQFTVKITLWSTANISWKKFLGPAA